MSTNAETIENKQSTTIRVSTLLRLRSFMYRVVKRAFDIVFALVGCIGVVLLIPFVKISYLSHGDKDPIFFKQKRIGLNGKEFIFYKFRSMVPNADKVLEEMLAKDPALRKEYRKNMKLKDDPRITPMGKVLRATSLDEFPQFFNVLKGNMSIIGNRPYMPREKKDIPAKYYERIITTKPGITGRWQVSGRSNVAFDKRVELDAGYSDTANFKSDMHIFLLTFLNVIKKDGAE